MTEALLKQIAKDVAIVKEKIGEMEANLADIASDLHEVKPEYIEKLERIEKEGTISKGQFEKKFGVNV